MRNGYFFLKHKYITTFFHFCQLFFIILLIYFINEEKVFNPKKVAQDLSFSLQEVLEIFDQLTSKGLVELKFKSGPIKEEYISLDELYKKLAYFITSNETTNKEAKKSNIYDLFDIKINEKTNVTYEISKKLTKKRP